MSTIEDKILDGPTIHYCDADNDDLRSGEDAGLDKDDPPQLTRNDLSSLFVRPDDESMVQNRIQSCSMNTGPKGVIADHRKHSLSRSLSQTDNPDLDIEFKELLEDDSIIRTIAERRIAQLTRLPTFGVVYKLTTGVELLDSIDKEHPNVLVIVHIYTRASRPCARVDKYLNVLANQYRQVKFLTLDANSAGLSDNFKKNGVPAILAYRGGEFVKSIVQLDEFLDRDFEVADLRGLLIDNGLL